MHNINKINMVKLQEENEGTTQTNLTLAILYTIGTAVCV